MKYTVNLVWPANTSIGHEVKNEDEARKYFLEHQALSYIFRNGRVIEQGRRGVLVTIDEIRANNEDGQHDVFLDNHARFNPKDEYCVLYEGDCHFLGKCTMLYNTKTRKWVDVREKIREPL